MRLLSWNVARRLQRLPDQAARVIDREPDIVALQEVTASSIPLWTAALATIGLTHVAVSPQRLKRHRVLIAAREPVQSLETVPAPWPEAVCSAHVGGLRVHAVHVPNAANGWVKVETLEAVAATVAAEDGPRLVCGDLNTPRRELPELRTFAYDQYGRLRPERGERWDEAERALLDGRTGLVDAFRAHHPGVKELSWEWPRWGGGYRLDHLLTAEIDVESVVYHHHWRKAGLSDHSALEAELTPRRRASATRR